jgi:betaine reductase
VALDGGIRARVAPLSRAVIKKREVKSMGKLAGKKLILLGERDGVPAPAMEACFKNSGAEVIFSVTECFV